MNANILTLATLLLVGSAITSCKNDSEKINPEIPAEPESESAPQPGKVIYNMTVDACKGGETRALADAGTTLTATWTAGDEVEVWTSDGTTAKYGTLTAESTGLRTKLTGTLETLPSDGEELKLKYLSASYNLQNGTLTGNEASIDKVCDYAEAEVTAKVSGTSVSSASAVFQSKQAIVKFTLKKASNNTQLSTRRLNITVAGVTYSIIPDASTSELYAALPCISNQTIRLSTNVYDEFYTYSKSNVTFDNGMFYRINVKMKEDTGALDGKFTIDADGTQVFFSKGNLQAARNSFESDWSWSFAATQWEYIGETDFYKNMSSKNGTFDLFGWVGSSSDQRSNPPLCYGLYTTSVASEYGTAYGESLAKEWGHVFGGVLSKWFTLSAEQWLYLCNTRSGATVNSAVNARYTLATINTDGSVANGMILFPDDVVIESDEATTWGRINGSSEFATKCTSEQWMELEAKGCVFLPAAGRRYGNIVNSADTEGTYWSSSSNTKNTKQYYMAYAMSFRGVQYSTTQGYYVTPNYETQRSNGYSVRLVRKVTD